MAYRISRLWIQIISRTSSAWKGGWCCSPSGCSPPTRGLNTCSTRCRRSWRNSPTWFTSCWAPPIRTNCANRAKPTGSDSNASPRRTKSIRTSFFTTASSESRNSRSSSARRTFTSHLISTRRRSPRARLPTPSARARLEGAVLSRKSFATKTLDQQPRELPELRWDHLSRMTDSTGIFQHAIYTVPNFSHGYCTDDNARAFILAVLLDELEEEPERVRTLATTYAAFLNHAFDAKTKRFHNLLSFDRRWLDEQGSEDSHARALWALGVGVGRSPHRSFQIMAAELFAQALPAATDFNSPRAWAFILIGIHEYLHRLSGDRMVNQIREILATRLMEIFDKVAQPDWPWFERELTYDNAKLAHALILTGRATSQPPMYERGLQALRWLAELQTSENGHLRPIGTNGFYPCGGTRAQFDQQPIEAQAMVSACLEAYRATSDPAWYEHAQRAFDWFLGWNDLGLEVYSHSTGGCRDALHVDRVNRNQGAESTLAFLLSLAEMHLMQNAVTVFSQPGS